MDVIHIKTFTISVNEKWGKMKTPEQIAHAIIGDLMSLIKREVIIERERSMILARAIVEFLHKDNHIAHKDCHTYSLDTLKNALNQYEENANDPHTASIFSTLQIAK